MCVHHISDFNIPDYDDKDDLVVEICNGRWDSSVGVVTKL
jgi:hypothetical protein